MKDKNNAEELPKQEEKSKMIFKLSDNDLEINENLNDSEKKIAFELLMAIGFVLGFNPYQDY